MTEKPEFTIYELNEIAEFICGRVDDLQEIIDDPRVTNKDTKRAISKDILQLKVLSDKLRPFYLKGK